MLALAVPDIQPQRRSSNDESVSPRVSEPASPPVRRSASQQSHMPSGTRSGIHRRSDDAPRLQRPGSAGSLDSGVFQSGRRRSSPISLTQDERHTVYRSSPLSPSREDENRVRRGSGDASSVDSGVFFQPSNRRRSERRRSSLMEDESDGSGSYGSLANSNAWAGAPMSPQSPRSGSPHGSPSHHSYNHSYKNIVAEMTQVGRGAQDAAAAVRANASRRTCNILVVDDNENNLRVISNMLQPSGYTVGPSTPPCSHPNLSRFWH